MKIDFHAHLFPRPFLEEIERRKLEFRMPGMPLSIFPKMYDLEERLRDMDRTGIDMQVLSLGPPGAEVGSARDSVELTTLWNDQIAKVVQADPKHFMGLAALPMQVPDAAVSELDRAVNELHLPGAQIFSNAAGKTLDAPEFWPLYGRAQELDVPIFIHPNTPVCTTGMMDFGLMIMLALPVDTSLAAARLVMSGVMEKYPRLKIVLAHLGAVLPYLIGRFDVNSETLAQISPGYDLRISQPPSVYFKRFYMDTVSHHAPAYYCAHMTSGADKIVLGSDYPYSRWDLAVEAIEELELPQADKEKIYGGNAARLLKLRTAGPVA